MDLSSAEKMNTKAVLRSWAWKREHRPDRDRFHGPYKHRLSINGSLQDLVISQRPFTTTGFASTVWDSAIVLSKYLEKWPFIVQGKSSIELGAGCGLPGIVAAFLGASSVSLADFPQNLDLLQKNVESNNVGNIVAVKSLVWGEKSDVLESSFRVAIATDVMYYVEAVNLLVVTLRMVSDSGTTILLAYGRNRQAEQTFLDKARDHFSVRNVTNEELDELYQCVDVDVLELKLKL